MHYNKINLVIFLQIHFVIFPWLVKKAHITLLCVKVKHFRVLPSNLQKLSAAQGIEIEMVSTYVFT